MPGAPGAEVPTVDPFKYDKLARRLREAAEPGATPTLRGLMRERLGLKPKHLRNAADLLECYTPPAPPTHLRVELTFSRGAGPFAIWAGDVPIDSAADPVVIDFADLGPIPAGSYVARVRMGGAIPTGRAYGDGT